MKGGATTDNIVDKAFLNALANTTGKINNAYINYNDTLSADEAGGSAANKGGAGGAFVTPKLVIDTNINGKSAALNSSLTDLNNLNKDLNNLNKE